MYMYILTGDCTVDCNWAVTYSPFAGTDAGYYISNDIRMFSPVDLARRCLVGLELGDMVERLLAKITACCIREGMLVYGKRSLVRGGELIFGCIYVFYWATISPLNKVQTFINGSWDCPPFLVLFCYKGGSLLSGSAPTAVFSILMQSITASFPRVL